MIGDYIYKPAVVAVRQRLCARHDGVAVRKRRRENWLDGPNRHQPFLTEISGIEAFDEPAVNLGEYRAGFVASALLGEEARGGRLIISMVPTDHSEHEVPGVADVGDRQ